MKLAMGATLIQQPKQSQPKPKRKRGRRGGRKRTATPTAEEQQSKPEPIVAVEQEQDNVAPELEAVLDYNADTLTVLEWVRHFVTAERVDVIGPNPPVEGWVWLTYPGKPSDQERRALKNNKFRWHSKRKQWYHRCGVPSKTRGKRRPEEVYASATVVEEEN